MTFMKHFSKSNIKVLHKVVAYAIVFCVIASSAESISFSNINIGFTDSVKVTADTIMSQFFAISTLPVNAISKMFTQSREVSAGVNKETGRSGKSGNKEEGSSGRASAGYSIMTGTNKIGGENLKVKYGFGAVNRQQTDDRALMSTVERLERDKPRLSREFITINIILMMLMLMLMRRNMGGDDNIFIKKIQIIR